jgi:YidC/Oxa1 family membrane protein insertase
VEWGTFAILSKLFYNILVYFYKLFGNYGLAIIGLTIITQLITFPLTYSSIKSAIKMRKLQPQIQLIQKLYKDDPKRLNMEIMNFYKEKKVNPFGGCLPLLLQIPIFWALFTMLRNTYDLRGASFVLWIKDLSQPDKIFIPGTNIGIPVLVFLMGATMLLQQYISGSFSEPQQKTFAIFMPILFTILFLNFPSGLVLYWFVNNIFSIVIQIVANKTVKV